MRTTRNNATNALVTVTGRLVAGPYEYNQFGSNNVTARVIDHAVPTVSIDTDSQQTE